MLPEDPEFNWLKFFAYGAFAGIGGFMGHLMRTLDSRKKVVWMRAWLEGISAGFVGLLVMLACLAMKLSEQWTGVIVGVCGWLGAAVTIRMLENIVRKRFGLAQESEPMLERSDDPPNTPPQ